MRVNTKAEARKLSVCKTLLKANMAEHKSLSRVNLDVVDPIEVEKLAKKLLEHTPERFIVKGESVNRTRREREALDYEKTAYDDDIEE